jgi:glutaredoxin
VIDVSIAGVKFYTRDGCHLCEDAKKVLLELQAEYDFDYEERKIDQRDEWTEKYGLMIPVIEIDGEVVQYGHVDKKFIYKTLTGKKYDLNG